MKILPIIFLILLIAVCFLYVIKVNARKGAMWNGYVSDECFPRNMQVILISSQN